MYIYWWLCQELTSKQTIQFGRSCWHCSHGMMIVLWEMLEENTNFIAVLFSSLKSKLNLLHLSTACAYVHNTRPMKPPPTLKTGLSLEILQITCQLSSHRKKSLENLINAWWLEWWFMSKSESLRPNDENCLRNGLMFLPFGSSSIVKMGWFLSTLY